MNELIPVKSSHIDAISYDEGPQILTVRFKADRRGCAKVWQYLPVPQALYEQMLDEDESVGKLLQQVRALPGITSNQIREEWAHD